MKVPGLNLLVLQVYRIKHCMILWLKCKLYCNILQVVSKSKGHVKNKEATLDTP